MHKVLEKVKEEFLSMLPPTIFFFVMFHVVSLVRVLIAKDTAEFHPLETISLAVGALLLGKAVLIADLLPEFNLYPKQPLIYNVIWKTVIYQAMVMAIYYVERLVDFSRKAGGIVAGNEKLLAETVWPHFWAIQIILFVLMLMYCTGRELMRAIGEDKVRRMFFGPRPLPTF
jgi:hypothetical protein